MPLNTKDDAYIILALIVINLFLYLNVSSGLATIFTFMTLTYLIVLSSRQLPKIELWSSGIKLPQTLAVTAVIFGIWTYASSFILKALGSVTFISYKEFFQTLRIYADVPVLSNDPSIIFFAYGVFIPVVETLFFLGVVLLLYSKVMNSKIGLSRLGGRELNLALLVSLLVGITASLYHLTVRTSSVVNPAAAAIVDIGFFALSSMLVYYSPKITGGRHSLLLPAALLHVMVNSSVLLVGGI
jgi:hypothetical protein